MQLGMDPLGICKLGGVNLRRDDGLSLDREKLFFCNVRLL